MATTVDGTAPVSGLVARTLWQRQLNHYPDTGRRVLYLGIVVLATIMLYYELYIPGAVSPTIIASFHMTFSYYVYIIVIGNAVGAFGSLLAGLADRWGRANLVAYGLVVTALLVLFGIPNAPNKLTFGILFGAIARGRGHHPGRHPGPDPGLLPAAGPGLGHGLLDPGPGGRQPGRRHRVQRHPVPPARLAGPVRHLRHRRASSSAADRAVRAEGAVPRPARPAHGQHARPAADRGPGQGHRPVREPASTRGGRCCTWT